MIPIRLRVGRCLTTIPRLRLQQRARSNATISSRGANAVQHTPIPVLDQQIAESTLGASQGLRINSGKFEVYNPIDDRYVQIPGRWLRDNFSAADSINQDTQQRQINVLKGGINCEIADVKPIENGQAFDITFGDGYKTVVKSNAITSHARQDSEIKRAGVLPITLWDTQIASQPPTVSYENVTRDGVGALLRQIRTYGFCFVYSTPATPEHTETLLEMIGPIRNTHYGAFYDFTADLSAKDTAYTSEALEPHTDNTYFTEPTGLQALHLLSHTEGSGGESSLVDGFAVANKLYQQDQAAYNLLSRVPVHAHASGNEGISIQPSQPVPVLSHHSELHHLTQVRWNNADRAGVSCSLSEMDAWYDAASKFDALISDPANQYWFQLTPGRVLIFDNWRLLHGRSAFTGKRRMSGGYINRDDFISKFRTTNMSREDVRATTLTG